MTQAQTFSCGICFEEKILKTDASPPCETCETQICRTCYKKWAESQADKVAFGEIYSSKDAHIFTCPMCRTNNKFVIPSQVDLFQDDKLKWMMHNEELFEAVLQGDMTANIFKIHGIGRDEFSSIDEQKFFIHFKIRPGTKDCLFSHAHRLLLIVQGTEKNTHEEFFWFLKTFEALFLFVFDPENSTDWEINMLSPLVADYFYNIVQSRMTHITPHFLNSCIKTLHDEWNPVCYTCKKPFGKLLVYARCKARHYCSRDCQTKNWPKHKLECYKNKLAKIWKAPTSFEELWSKQVI